MLPVSILIPTRNVREMVAAHVASINVIAPLVGEIVVADSESSDGTVEFIKGNLRHKNVTYLSLPPGLYQAWNAGISHLTEKYCYIATVGDGVDPAALQALVHCAEKMEADVVVSPPTFVDEAGRQLSMRWPIHDFIERYALAAPALVDGFTWFVWNALSVPNSLLGSSASNLYRTKALQEAPFPVGHGVGGDAAWAIERSFRFRFAVAPELSSRFLIHEKPAAKNGRRGPLISTSLRDLAREVYDGIESDALPEDLRPYVNRLRAFWTCKKGATDAKSRYRRIRQEGVAGYLSPRMWRAMSEHKQREKQAEAIRSEILRTLPLTQLDLHSP